MKTVYLVQGCIEDLLFIQELIPSHQFLITLNYERDPQGESLNSNLHIYFPNSTWASGRNRLLEEALDVDIEFDYFILLDADLRIIKGDFYLFEQFLDEFQPKLGLPLGDQIKVSYRYRPEASVQTQISFDQIMQAYRSDVIQESIVVPYRTDLDSESWWYSCEINSYLSILSCGVEILQFNDFEIVNSRHDGPELNKQGLSNYQSGISPDGLRKCRNLIENAGFNSINMIGTLFHPKFLPKWIYFPSLKQLLQRQYENTAPISLRSICRASLKSLQLLLFRRVFWFYFNETKTIRKSTDYRSV